MSNGFIEIYFSVLYQHPERTNNVIDSDQCPYRKFMLIQLYVRLFSGVSSTMHRKTYKL